MITRDEFLAACKFDHRHPFGEEPITLDDLTEDEKERFWVAPRETVAKIAEHD